jgi:hypothetical protein
MPQLPFVTGAAEHRLLIFLSDVYIDGRHLRRRDAASPLDLTGDEKSAPAGAFAFCALGAPWCTKIGAPN